MPSEFVDALNAYYSCSGSGGRNEDESRSLVTGFLIAGVPLQDALTAAELEGSAIDGVDEMVSCKSRQKTTERLALPIHLKHKRGRKLKDAHQCVGEQNCLDRATLENVHRKAQRGRMSVVKI